MEKLDANIANFRCKEKTKKIIWEMAATDKRAPSEFLRICLEDITEQYDALKKQSGETLFYQEYFLKVILIKKNNPIPSAYA